MKKRIQGTLALLLLLGLLTSCTPLQEHDVVDRVQEMVTWGTEILEDVRTTLQEELEKLRQQLQEVLQPETPGMNSTSTDAPETVAMEPAGDSIREMEPFANAHLRRAFLALPDRYDFYFDGEAEAENFRLLNDYRRENGLPALVWRKDLAQAARYKSLAMLQHDYFSHSNPNLGNKDFDELLWEELNLKYTGIGENLAFIAKDGRQNDIPAEDLFRGWQESPGHNAQMLSRDHRFVGIGVVRGLESGSTYKGYKPLIGTQHFGF